VPLCLHMTSSVAYDPRRVGSIANDGVYKTLYANNYTWNLVSNMIFLEAPAGVGFSYTNDPAGLTHNDSSTAADNLAAVLAFFEGFPELRANPFWVTGES